MNCAPADHATACLQKTGRARFARLRSGGIQDADPGHAQMGGRERENDTLVSPCAAFSNEITKPFPPLTSLSDQRLAFLSDLRVAQTKHLF